MDKKHQSQPRVYTRWHFKVYATVGTLEDLVVRQRQAVKVRNPFSTPVAERPLRRKITQEIGLRLQILASNEASMELQVSRNFRKGTHVKNGEHVAANTLPSARMRQPDEGDYACT
jgi:hypothetical protein